MDRRGGGGGGGGGGAAEYGKERPWSAAGPLLHRPHDGLELSRKRRRKTSGVRRYDRPVSELYVRYVKNDPRTPTQDFPGFKAGDKWCICAGRCEQAVEAKVAPSIVVAATHEKAAEWPAVRFVAKAVPTYGILIFILPVTLLTMLVRVVHPHPYRKQ